MTNQWDGTTRAVKHAKPAAEARRQKRLAAEAPVAAAEPGTDELADMVEELQKGIGAIDEKVSKYLVVPGRVIRSIVATARSAHACGPSKPASNPQP